MLAGALALGVAAATGTPAASAPASAVAPRLAGLCDGCAIVDSVTTEKQKGEGGIVGKVGGAVVGGVLGHQIGGGTGKTLATIGGAAAGAYAGNEVQKRSSAKTIWRTRVTQKDGSQRSFETSTDPGWKPGTVVRIDGATLRKP
ncbi:MAG TPA: glycine zipper 2TM domain-containing protein [Burkholderiaceae bacterium]|nr:glycine zipper 2TM domain-containing protein [Burkholderiaceae bacterium]